MMDLFIPDEDLYVRGLVNLAGDLGKGVKDRLEGDLSEDDRALVLMLTSLDVVWQGALMRIVGVERYYHVRRQVREKLINGNTGDN